MATKTTTTLKTTGNAKAIAKAVKATSLYSDKLMSFAFLDKEATNGTFKVVTANFTDFDASKALIKSLSLDEKHNEATARCEVWLDAKHVTMYIGALPLVYAQLGGKSQSEAFTRLNEAFNKTLQTKWNNRYSTKCETRHFFETIDEFNAFFADFATCVAERIKATQKAKNEATDNEKEAKATGNATKAKTKEKGNEKEAKAVNK